MTASLPAGAGSARSVRQAAKASLVARIQRNPHVENRDAELLEQHQPDIYAWVVHSLSGLAQHRLAEPAPQTDL